MRAPRQNVRQGPQLALGYIPVCRSLLSTCQGENCIVGIEFPQGVLRLEKVSNRISLPFSLSLTPQLFSWQQRMA